MRSKPKKMNIPILHTGNGLSTKFQIKLTVFKFWNEFPEKGYFQSKQIKWTIPFKSAYSN